MAVLIDPARSVSDSSAASRPQPQGPWH